MPSSIRCGSQEKQYIYLNLNETFYSLFNGVNPVANATVPYNLTKEYIYTKYTVQIVCIDYFHSKQKYIIKS